ncbi:MAG TPA: type II toxin-antitoxin system PemK/MazF family toxin [Bacteroidia bacterium]|nr:type II toxin-antitoxin system PemK/MazF family toxin [Bacteroidia bacterium]
MNSGEIVLIPFPFSEISNVKVRPAIILFLTKDKYRDITVCAISSVISSKLSKAEFIINPSPTNGLRAVSVVKVDGIVTLRKNKVISKLGKLNHAENKKLKGIYLSLMN